jgi:hypothetical protein
MAKHPALLCALALGTAAAPASAKVHSEVAASSTAARGTTC